MTTAPSVLSNTWGHTGICFRKQQSIGDTPAKLVIPVDMTRDDINLQLFEHLFPKKFMVEVMIPTMNKLLKTSVSYGELLSWIGLWILMSTVDGSDRHSFWLTKDPNMYEGASPHRNHFEEILGSIAYTSNNPPELLDKFWEVRQLIGEWNENMKKISSQVGSMQSMSQC